MIKQVNGKAQRDKHVVEAIVRRFGPISRAKIHELSQIRLSAMSTLVRSLTEEGRLVGVRRRGERGRAQRRIAASERKLWLGDRH